jgi:hypothetical protein
VAPAAFFKIKLKPRSNHKKQEDGRSHKKKTYLGRTLGTKRGHLLRLWLKSQVSYSINQAKPPHNDPEKAASGGLIIDT